MKTLTRGFALLMTLAIPLAGIATALAQTPTASPRSGDDTYLGALPWDLPEDAERMVVDVVVDGDTVKLTKPNDDWWESYRIIGIQAPEMDGPYTDEQCFAPEAKAFLAQLLPKGTEVYVQRDISDKDRNGRFLRHVFILNEETGGAFLVSEILVLGGYANARSYKPDDLYDDILAEAQQIADQQDAGLWNSCAA
jgi:endonuclease YncB( thermonuclease family)